MFLQNEFHPIVLWDLPPYQCFSLKLYRRERGKTKEQNIILRNKKKYTVGTQNMRVQSLKEGIFTHLEWDDLSLVLLLIEFSSFLCVVDFNHMRPN